MGPGETGEREKRGREERKKEISCGSLSALLEKRAGRRINNEKKDWGRENPREMEEAQRKETW